MINIGKLLIFVIIVVISKLLHLNINMANNDDSHQEIRLPKNIVPEHYDLWVKPNFVNFTFEGRVEITYKNTDQKPTSKVVLHVNDIKINKVHLNGSNFVKTVYNDKTETATLHFDSDIPQEGKIVLDYVGNLNELLTGFYRTSVTIDNTKIYAATTKFEPTEARRFLPCWDEPAIKATFAITLTYNRWLELPCGKKIEYVALSNCPILSQEGDEEVTVKFKTSPKMSTYLLALIVGPFEYIEKSDGKRPVRVYTPPGKKEFGRFALDVACKSLQFYENYFEIEYPLEKMDLIAIPDFTSGAMENWGLVTFRETALLVDPENSSKGAKQWVGIVVIHELAHQWFGNLVTMEWWTHLWLNEGFACFMEHLCGDHIFPEYDMWSQFVSNAYSMALNLDSMHNSHPIEVPVNHPSEVKEIFDAISYKKGASIIRMIYNYIGDDAFRKGMKEYLTKYAYKNTVTEDLWECLEKASNKPVTKLGSDWTSQMGYPWLSVESSSIEGDKIKLKLTQEKFSSDGINLPEEMNMKWHIPISTINGGEPAKKSPMILIDSKTSEIIIDNAGDNWIKLNPDSVALYRTAYPESMSEKFLPAITNKTMPPVDRLSLQSDFFALALAGKLDIVSYLKFLQSFDGETEYPVWYSIDSSIERLSIILAGTDYIDLLKAYGRSLYKEVYEKIGWEAKPSEKHTDSLKRTLILNRLVSLEHQDFISEAKRRFKSHVSKENLIPADLRNAIYKTIARFGDDNEFNSIFDIFRSTDLNEEKNRAAGSLGFTKDPKRIARVVDFCFSDEIRDQDRIFVFSQLGSSNPDIAWKVFQEKKAIIEQKYQASHLFRAFVKSSTENFASEEKAQEVEKFFNENNFPQAKRTIQQSLETIRLNANLLTRDGKAIKAFLSTLKLIK